MDQDFYRLAKMIAKKTFQLLFLKSKKNEGDSVNYESARVPPSLDDKPKVKRVSLLIGCTL